MCYSIMVEQDTGRLASRYSATVDRHGFDEYRNNSKVDPKKYKPLLENPRIYPKYYAPVLIHADGNRILTPMRYRVKPSWSAEEIPAKYNVFNCRLDAIEKRKTWQPLFMKRHGVLIFKNFFEWVVDPSSGKKKVISFNPENHEYVVCPVLWDEWRSVDGSEVLRSFAVITTDPAPEVLAQGHDRTPIFLKEAHIDQWMSPAASSKKEIYDILLDNEVVRYEFEFAA